MVCFRRKHRKCAVTAPVLVAFTFLKINDREAAAVESIQHDSIILKITPLRLSDFKEDALKWILYSESI